MPSVRTQRLLFLFSSPPDESQEKFSHNVRQRDCQRDDNADDGFDDRVRQCAYANDDARGSNGRLSECKCSRII